jgi:hypothetical protein
MRKFNDGDKVTIFVDGFGELESVYNADTQEFVCEDGMRVSHEMLASGPMNGILNDDDEEVT